MTVHLSPSYADPEPDGVPTSLMLGQGEDSLGPILAQMSYEKLLWIVERIGWDSRVYEQLACRELVRRDRAGYKAGLAALAALQGA